MDSRAGHHFHTSSDWPASDFPLGFSKAGRRKFILRSRGRRKFECEGFLHDGEGRTISFQRGPKYQQE